MPSRHLNMFNLRLCNAAIIRYSQLKFGHMHLCGMDYKYCSPHCCKCNSFGCTAAIRCDNACHGPHSDSLYSGSEHCQFNSPRLVKREAGFPNPRRALIGSNQLWRVNDSAYYRELQWSAVGLNMHKCSQGRWFLSGHWTGILCFGVLRGWPVDFSISSHTMTSSCKQFDPVRGSHVCGEMKLFWLKIQDWYFTPNWKGCSIQTIMKRRSLSDIVTHWEIKCWDNVF